MGCTGTRSASSTRSRRGWSRRRRRARISRALASTPGAWTSACWTGPGPSSRNPYHYRDGRTDGMVELAARKDAAGGDLPHHRHPVHADKHAVPASRLRGLAVAGGGGHPPDDARPRQLLADRGEGLRVHDLEHQPTLRPQRAGLGAGSHRQDGHPRAHLPDHRLTGRVPRRSLRVGARGDGPQADCPSRPSPRTTRPRPSRRSRPRATSPTSPAVPGRSSASRPTSRSPTMGPCAATSPTRAASAARYVCSGT